MGIIKNSLGSFLPKLTFPVHDSFDLPTFRGDDHPTVVIVDFSATPANEVTFHWNLYLELDNSHFTLIHSPIIYIQISLA